jgi:hypothetical protein
MGTTDDWGKAFTPLRRPTPLEQAAAMRTAAEFCEDPSSPKVHGQLARGARGGAPLPWDDRATHWCAVGYVYKQLGDQVSIPNIGMISSYFDDRRYREAARELRVAARMIERTIPVTGEVATSQEVTV